MKPEASPVIFSRPTYSSDLELAGLGEDVPNFLNFRFRGDRDRFNPLKLPCDDDVREPLQVRQNTLSSRR